MAALSVGAAAFAEKSSGVWKNFAPAKCSGSAAEKWALKSVEVAASGETTGGGHHRMLAGDVIWCLKCGCYGDTRARGLTDACRGKPRDASGGGRAGQLSYLLAGKKPKTRTALPASVDENGWALSPGMGESFGDHALMLTPRTGSRPYHADGNTSSQKMLERLECVRAKEKERRGLRRRLCGKQNPGTEWRK